MTSPYSCLFDIVGVVTTIFDKPGRSPFFTLKILRLTRVRIVINTRCAVE